MTETMETALSGVAETLLLPLYIRAMESQRPDALIKDDKAFALITRMDPDSSWVKQMGVDEGDRVALVLRNREIDRHVQDYLARNREAVVVHIGCGLDSRFERVDNGRVQWYDLDLPEVIDLRRKLLGDEGGRYHLIAGSVFDDAWLDIVGAHRQRPCLFLAEGVFMYFDGAMVQSLVLRLRNSFPGAEMVFDAFSPLMVRLNNLRISRTKIGARYHWGLKRGTDVERWGDGITMLDEWFVFRRPEPRLANVRWARHIPLLARVMGVFHYRLGPAGE